jgi:hypothetical protein
MHQSGAWQVSAAVWNDGLFTALATHAILLLNMEVANHKARRRAFQLLIDSLLSDPNVLAQFDPEGIHPENAQSRLPSDITGPSMVEAILVRGPRRRMDSQEVE